MGKWKVLCNMNQTKVRKDQVGIDGENETTEIALRVFFGEFVFSDLWFSHRDIGQGSNIQLADLIINIGDGISSENKKRQTYRWRR